MSLTQAAAIEQTVTAGVDTTNIGAIVRAGGPRAALVDQTYRVGVGPVPPPPVPCPSPSGNVPA